VTTTTVSTTRATPLPDIDHGRAGLANQIRSEWTKLRSVRSTWICLAVIVVGSIGLSALVSNVVGVLGALVITSEYATGSIRTTLSTTSRRTTVLAAKLLVIGAVVLVVSEVTSFASFFTGQVVLLAHGGKALPAGSTIIDQVRSSTIPVVSITSAGAARAVFLAGVYLLLLTLLACGLGFILRHTAGAISAFVGILLVLPLVVDILPSSFSSSFERYLPSNLGLAMVVVTTRKTDFAGVLLTPWAAAGLLALYTAVVIVVATVLLVRRDA